MSFFRDNWSYLKVEINWLERLLLTAAAKARQTEATFTRFAKNSADRATHAWWEGLVTFDKVGYDSPPPKSLNPPAKPALNYQQSLDARIQQSREQGISLALPTLCDRYGLSLFEKHTLLLAMAPEVHRRYGELCGYLTGQTGVGLPTVDLALRLFCRDDRAWREGRSQLVEGLLSQQGWLVPASLDRQSFLETPLKLAPDLVSYLLSENPGFNFTREKTSWIQPGNLGDREGSSALSDCLEPAIEPLLTRPWRSQSAIVWVGLVGFLERLKRQDDKLNPEPRDCYAIVAERLNRSVMTVDLAVDLAGSALSTQLNCIERALQSSESPILIVENAQQWLSARSDLTRSQQHQAIQALRSHSHLVIFEMPYAIAIAQPWRSMISETYAFSSMKSFRL